MGFVVGLEFFWPFILCTLSIARGRYWQAGGRNPRQTWLYSDRKGNTCCFSTGSSLSLRAPESPAPLGSQPRWRPDAAGSIPGLHPLGASPGSIPRLHPRAARTHHAPNPSPRHRVGLGTTTGREARGFQGRIYSISPRPLCTLWWFIYAGKSQENTPDWTVLLPFTFKQLHSQGMCFSSLFSCVFHDHLLNILQSTTYLTLKLWDFLWLYSLLAFSK